MQIATGILLDGVYVVGLDSRQHQRLVDLRWASHEAGRMFGFPTTVQVSEPSGPRDPTVTVTITRADAISPAPADRVVRVEALLRAVEREHLRLVGPREQSDDLA